MAFSIGISVSDFKHLTPKKLEMALKGYRMRKKAYDEQMWAWVGSYGLSALIFAIDHCMNKNARTKYIEEPIMRTQREKEALTEEEIQKQRELFVAKLQAMATNFEVNHPKKEVKE